MWFYLVIFFVAAIAFTLLCLLVKHLLRCRKSRNRTTRRNNINGHITSNMTNEHTYQQHLPSANTIKPSNLKYDISFSFVPCICRTLCVSTNDIEITTLHDHVLEKTPTIVSEQRCDISCYQI